MPSIDQLYIISGIILGVCSFFSIKIIRSTYKTFKLRSDMNKAYRAKEAEVKKYKEEGNLHSWVTLPVNTGKGIMETNVCQETGYCPAVEGFIPVPQVKHLLEMKKQGEDYEKFKAQEKKRIQQYFSIEDCDIDELVSEIHDIKRKFHVELMNKSIASLKEKLGGNVQVVTSIEEFEEVMKNAKDS